MRAIESLLWAKWEAGVGHKWFRFTHGDIDQAHVCETHNGLGFAPHRLSRSRKWEVARSGGVFHPSREVVGHTLRRRQVRLSGPRPGKVQVVNDIVEEHPFLVVTNAFASPDKAYSIYDADR